MHLIIRAAYRYFVQDFEPHKAAFNNFYYEYNLQYFLEKCGHNLLYKTEEQFFDFYKNI